ncbi:FadR/GntR family transcriptional regulator [Rhodococcus koreensis]|uniref:FadR/GntR family transcriptional regulator n=1 Tax=Rhodococcus koreensis TaxID=99653 RepID=UPI00197FC524|nr:FCD domain-containing protein [Rhodococcus koreensis]QSE81040.1 FadR family transcriptional regulator [Rhodococcus koreensis]
MTDLAQRMLKDAALSRPEQAALAIGQLAERAPQGARLGTKKELQEQCGVAKSTFNEALRILQSRGVITVRSGPGGGLFAAARTPIARLGDSILSRGAAEGNFADVVRVRDALDPLVIEYALDHSSAVDIARMRTALGVMRQSADDGDATAFVRAHGELHAAIARVSPNAILKSIYLSLLEVVESPTAPDHPVGRKPLAEYLAELHQVDVDLVDALDTRDRTGAMRLIHKHNISQPPKAAS